MLTSHQLSGTNSALPVIVLIHGYCQTGAETWHDTIEALRRLRVQNQIVLIERVPGDRAGRQTIAEQMQAMRDYMQNMFNTVLQGRQVIWVGHSFGGAIADDLAETFPRATRGVITLAQTSTSGFWILFHLGFWLHGGIISLPAVLKSIATGRSVRFPRGMARGLFAGGYCSESRFAEFYAQQRPDSAWLFVQFLFTYWLTATTLRRLRKLGKHDRKIIFGFRSDALISSWSLRWLAWRTNSRLLWVNAPHCWWLGFTTQLLAEELAKEICKLNNSGRMLS